jgi:hypothetical protein
MKRFLIASLLLTTVGFFSFRTINDKYAEILKALGIPPAMAKEKIGYGFMGSYFSPPSNSTYKTYPAGKRAEAVQQLGYFAKTYLTSVEFQKTYKAEVEVMKPSKPKSIEERLAEQTADFKKMIKQNEEMLKNPQLKAGAESNLKGLKDLLASYEDKNHPRHAKQMSSIQMMYDGDMKWYNAQVAKLEAKYPADIKQFLKMRLQEFLDISATVDYNAELKQDGRLKRFVNPAYERQSMNWKYCFRAGKETTEAARAFVQQWLKELN